jgi:hypothetical protein
MALNAGSVTVNADGTYSGTGLAKAIMDAYIPLVLSYYTTAQQPSVKVGVAHFCGDLANTLSSTVITHITTNAVVPAAGIIDSVSGACTGSTTIT